LYTGIYSKFDRIIDTPVKDGHEFIGWTKTLNGTDYIDTYNDEENLTVYASWIDVSGVTDLTLFEIEDSSFEGIKVLIVNPPENNYRRSFYINGKEIGTDSLDKPEKYKKVWAYPFTETGKEYSISVSYSTEGYGFLESSNTLTITAESGIGEFKVTNEPEFYIENNILKWTTKPEVQIGDGISPKVDSNWDEYYLLEIQSTKTTIEGKEGSWKYISWNYLGASCDNGFNFKNHVKTEVLNGTYYDLCFSLKYVYNSGAYGDYFIKIFDYGDTPRFNIEL